MSDGKGIIFLGVAALAVGAVVASGAMSDWDSGIDEATKNQAKSLLANEQNPAVLRAFAAQLRMRGYPKAADLLERRAAALESGLARPPSVTQAPAALPQGEPMSPALYRELAAKYASEQNPGTLREVASGLHYTGWPATAGAFEARAAALEAARGQAPQPTPPHPQKWDPGLNAAQWEASLRGSIVPAELDAASNLAKSQNYPLAAATFFWRAETLRQAEKSPYSAQPGAPPLPSPAVVPASWQPPTQMPPAPPRVEVPPIPGAPPPVQMPPAPPPVQMPPVPTLPGMPPLPAPPAGFPAPPAGFPVPTLPGMPPAPPAPVPGLPTIPGLPTPTPTAVPPPSVYGLPLGGWVNETRVLAYVVQAGDYGMRIAQKFLGKNATWNDVTALVKANPGKGDWSKMMPGTDLVLPTYFFTLPPGAVTTQRPSPPPPAAERKPTTTTSTTRA